MKLKSKDCVWSFTVTLSNNNLTRAREYHRVQANSHQHQATLEFNNGPNEQDVT